MRKRNSGNWQRVHEAQRFVSNHQRATTSPRPVQSDKLWTSGNYNMRTKRTRNLSRCYCVLAVNMHESQA